MKTYNFVICYCSASLPLQVTTLANCYLYYIMTVNMNFGFVPSDPVCFDKLSRCDK